MDVNNGVDGGDDGGDGGGNDGSNGGVDGANSHSRSCRGGNGEAKRRTGRWSLGRMATIPIPAVQLAHYNIRPYASQPGSHKSLVALTLGKRMKKTTADGIDCSSRNDDDDVDEADGSRPGRCRSASSNNNWLVKFTKRTY